MEEKTLKQIMTCAQEGKYRRYPVSRELYADAFTPVEVMRSLRAASRHCYLLESAEELLGQAEAWKTSHEKTTEGGVHH